MKLTVNGDLYDHDGDATLTALLQEFNADRARIAVVLNDRVVARTDYETAEIKPDDCVEILTLAGGG